MASPTTAAERELKILSPDGKTRRVPLEGDRFTLGRAHTCELCYPEDAGLSRQHVTFERTGSEWNVRDLGSKNGTMLNGARVAAPTTLHAGDRVTAGHLIVVYESPSQPADSARTVIFVEGSENDTASTLVTSLERVIKGDDKRESGSGPGQAYVSALIRAGNELSGQRPLPELFRLILDLSIQAVRAERGVLMSLEQGDELVVRATKGDGFRISGAVRDRVINQRSSVLVRDAQMDAAFRERRSIVEQNVRTLMAVPLQSQDRTIGLIYVDSPSVMREFTADDLSLLTVMANVAAIRIEHTRLAEIEQSKQLMARELDQAAEIQRRFLPSAPPTTRGLDLAGHNAPCRTVGGDYYDFFCYDQDRVAMVLGDVSGKGMPASLLMMGLQARVQVLADEPKDLAMVMTRLNRATCANCPDNRFISLFFCILDGVSGELTFCNAGHNPPLIVRANGKYETLDSGGPVLGILPSFDYHKDVAHLEEGDLLAIYSDGVTEAATPDDEEFEIANLAKALIETRTEPARDIISKLNLRITAWTKGAPPADDVTVIVARRVPIPPAA